MGIGAIGDAVGGLLGGGAGKTVEGIAPIAQQQIKIGGAPLSDDVLQRLEHVVVIDRLRVPGSFAISFRDPGLDVIKKAHIEIGAAVTIEASAPGIEPMAKLMVGEITAIEAEYDGLGTRVVARGYDLMHRLSAGTKSRTFQNVTYADIVSKIVALAGLQADVDSTSGTIPHVVQANVSDLHFIHHLAARVGYDVSFRDGRLKFKRPTKASSVEVATLEWGQNLREFRARISAAGQVREVSVRGWNPDSQKALIGKSRAGTDRAQLTTSVAKLAGTSQGKMHTVVDQPMHTQGLADSLADAVAEQISSAAYEATALVIGSPALQSGKSVTITKVGSTLEGKWVITSARHEIGYDAYRTHLEFSGHQDRSLLGLAAGAGSQPATRPVIQGVVTAVVTDIVDPDKVGRVKVEYAWLGERMESYWARVARPSAGKDYGILWFPDVREEVLVAFEHGDINFPIVIGSLWNKKALPPAALVDSAKQGKFENHAIATPGGHKIVFYDKPDDAGIQLTTKDQKVFIKLGQGKKTMELFLDGTELTITSKGDLKLTADGGITIDSKKKVEIKSGGGIDVNASGNATIKGAKVAVN